MMMMMIGDAFERLTDFAKAHHSEPKRGMDFSPIDGQERVMCGTPVHTMHSTWHEKGEGPVGRFPLSFSLHH